MRAMAAPGSSSERLSQCGRSGTHSSPEQKTRARPLLATRQAEQAQDPAQTLPEAKSPPAVRSHSMLGGRQFGKGRLQQAAPPGKRKPGIGQTRAPQVVARPNWRASWQQGQEQQHRGEGGGHQQGPSTSSAAGRRAAARA